MIKKKFNENSLGEDNIWRLLLKLTIPSMLAQFVNVFYGIVDRIFIGNIDGIGALALAGVGVTTPVITLLTSFAYLAGMGGAPLAAIKMGSGEKGDAEKILFNSFVLLSITAVILTAVFFGVKTPLLKLFGATENTIGYANEYMTYYLIGAIFAMLTLGLNTFITAQGFSKIAMASVLIGAVINIALDPIFIFVLKLDVKGAAIATVIAQFFSCVWVLAFLFGKKTFIRLKLRFKAFSLKFIKKILTLGISPFLIMCTESVIIIALNSVISRTAGSNADIYLAAATIVVSFLQLVINPLGGITMGAQPLLSYNLGAGKIDRIRGTILRLFVLCFAFNAIMFTLAMTVPSYFSRIFTSDMDIIDAAALGIRINTAGLLLLAFQYAIVDSFTALNCPKYAVFLSLTRKLGIILPLTFLLPILTKNPILVFAAEPIADAIGGILSLITFYIFNKRVLPRYDKNSPLYKSIQ